MPIISIKFAGCVGSHKKSESLAQIHITMTEIQHFFLGDCFLLAHPVDIKLRGGSLHCGNVGPCPPR